MPDSYVKVFVGFGTEKDMLPLSVLEKKTTKIKPKPKPKVTYKMIMEYIETTHGFKVHSAYIAEVKRSLGLVMKDAPNGVKVLKNPRKHPTDVQVEAIKDALRYYKVC